jgi:hypothetical protein
MFKNMLFKDLKQLLFKLEFQSIPTSGNHYVFQHPFSEALAIIPKYENQAYVDKIHLVAMRRILIEYGLIDGVKFDYIWARIAS